ncbi:MAG: hypothetical protein SynsKO_08320 [Synoicihabitans sp.]
MNTRRAALVAVVVTVALVWGVWRAGPPRESPAFLGDRPIDSPASPQVEVFSDDSPVAEAEEFLVEPENDPLEGVVGEGLNRVGGSINRDLQIVTDILEAWQTNFPNLGNPVGENHEIMTDLMGRNRFRIEFIPPDHPALNDRGELCDRWGTPFMFHQISGTQMEIRSAGPDRELYTDDDSVWEPVVKPGLLE